MQDKGQKTEKPTQKRLEKARKQGQVPQSQELGGALSLIVLVMVTTLMASKMKQWFMEQIREGVSCDTQIFNSSSSLIEFFNGKIIAFAIVSSPFLLALMVAGIAASVICGGMTFTAHPLKPKGSAISPVKGFKKLFGLDSLVRLLMSILKLIFVAAIVYFYLKTKIETVASIRWAWNDEILTLICQLIFGLCLRVCIGLFIIALADFTYQKWKYIKDLKMTKQEIKEEHKNYEGSPEVKRRIKQLQFNAAMKRMMQQVPTADVVLVNPTHFAVAVKYDSKKMAAPIVVAKGADNMCEKIKEVARAHGVPVVSKPQLARTIYHSVDLDHPIPENLFLAVAEVLAMIYRLRHRRA